MGYVRGEDQYLNWADKILKEGEATDDRTNVGTIEVFGSPRMKIDLREEFPLLTTKHVPHRLISSELAWMLHGDTNLKYLSEHNNHIWDDWPYKNYVQQTENRTVTKDETMTQEWTAGMREFSDRILNDADFAEKWGELGPVYGRQWRNWKNYDESTTDQLATIQTALRQRTKSLSRRLIVSAWNVGELAEMEKAGLPPCHTFYQFNSSSETNPETGKPYLDLILFQRSADWFLGVPFNMAQYAMLLKAMAQVTDHDPRFFYHSFGSAHIYKNHIDQMKEQLSRRGHLYPAPQLAIETSVKDIGEFEPEDFRINGYQHHPAIKGKVAV